MSDGRARPAGVVIGQHKPGILRSRNMLPPEPPIDPLAQAGLDEPFSLAIAAPAHEQRIGQR